MNRTNKIFGSILVLLGLIFFLKNLSVMNPVFELIKWGLIIANFWPSIFLILPGLIFHYGFVSGKKKEPGLLVPGGILLILGIAFQLNMIFGLWAILWPIYIFAVAFGLFELYIFGNKDIGLLIPIGILSGLSVIFFTVFSVNELLGVDIRKLVIPSLLLIVGLGILFSGKRKK